MLPPSVKNEEEYSMSVVTVSREFGSGGKEFGKRLAKELGFVYVDKEIAHELADKTDMSESYIEHFLDTGIPVGLPSSSSGVPAFSYSPDETQKNINLQLETHRFLKGIAEKKDIVIVGRAADIILQEFDPFRIFVYGDLPSKIERSKGGEYNQQGISDKDIVRNMRLIDSERHQHHALFTNVGWGDKLGYDLCINSSNVDLEKIAPVVADYVRVFLGK